MSFKQLCKKESITYKRGDNFFIYNDDEKIEFLEIEDISSKVTAESQNGVYLQRELVVELKFTEDGLRLKADTKNIEQYKLLSDKRVQKEYS